jgi:hypothetical protein
VEPFSSTVVDDQALMAVRRPDQFARHPPLLQIVTGLVVAVGSAELALALVRHRHRASLPTPA